MRPLIMMLMLAGFIWLIRYSFYSHFNKKMIHSRKQENRASASNRKQVESRVIENPNSNYDDDKQ